MKRYLPLLCLPVALALIAACSSSDSSNKATSSNNADGGTSSGNANSDGGSQPGVVGDTSVNPIDGVTGATLWSSDDINILSSFLDGPTWSVAQNVYLLSAPESPQGFVLRLYETGVVGPTRQAPAPNRVVGQAIDPANGDVLSVVTQAIQRTPVTAAATVTDLSTVKTICTGYDPATNPPSTDIFDADAGAPAGDGTFSSLNDLVISSKGAIYFTDPGFGVDHGDTPYANHVFVLPKGGTKASIVAAYKNAETPNGIALSADEKTLYFSLTKNFNAPPSIYKMTVADDGSVDNKQVPALFAALDPAEVVDGLATDTAGNLYVALSSSVAVYKADGTAWGKIPVAVATGDTVVGVTFGGPNLTELFITTGGTAGSGLLFRADVKVKGNPQ